LELSGHAAEHRQVHGSYVSGETYDGLEPTGIEPATPSLQSRPGTLCIFVKTLIHRDFQWLQSPDLQLSYTQHTPNCNTVCQTFDKKLARESESAVNPSDLAEMSALWDRLPAKVRAGLLALARASSET